MPAVSKQQPPYVDTEINRAESWLIIRLNIFYISFVVFMQFGVAVADLVRRLLSIKKMVSIKNQPEKVQACVLSSRHGQG